MDKGQEERTRQDKESKAMGREQGREGGKKSNSEGKESGKLVECLRLEHLGKLGFCIHCRIVDLH